MSFRRLVIIIPIVLVIIGVGYYSVAHILARGAMNKRRGQLASEIDAFQKKADDRQPLFGKALEGDGGPELLAVAREATKIADKETILDLQKLLSPRPDKAIIDRTQPFLKGVEPLLSRVRKAVEKTQCLVPYNIAQIDSEPLPHVFRGIGFALILSGNRYREKQQNFEAMRRYLIAARYGQDFSRKAPLRYRRDGAEVTIAALREAMRLLTEQDVRLRDLRKLRGACDKLEVSEPDFSDNLQAECFQDEYAIIRAGEKIGFIPGSVSISGTGVKKFTTLAGYAASRKKFLKWYDAARQDAGRPYPAAHELLVKRINGRILDNWLVCAIAWDFSEIYALDVLSLAFCRAMRFTLWLRIFKAEKGRFPKESIEEAGQYLPVDPFTAGKKFNYVFGYAGGTRFYSVGSDAMQNGGKGARWEDKRGEDVIFPAASIFRHR
ncbi:MAG: hypothetical protein E3J72_13160 [Planctomycetota bacterium]|nr:MAG: hypothetical protein E3J72_13160 [Planctomycetota bacterium]